MTFLRVSLASLLLSSTVVAAQQEGGGDPVAASIRPIALNDGKLSGPGAAWLRDQAAAAHFFMLGEQHATADIAEWSTALYAHIADLGYDHVAVEVGPWSTPVMERLLREPDGAFERYLADGRPLTFPFFFFAEEVAFARSVLSRSRATQALWGVDQEFIAGAPPLLDLLSQRARTDDQRQAVDAVRRKLATNPMLLGMGDDTDWQPLVDAFATDGDPEARRLLDEILLSRRVYSPFVGRGGAIQTANELRERYMKENFRRHLQRATRDGVTPRVFMKFGANHVVYGHSATHVISLGTYVRETALARGQETFNIHVDCRGGEMRDPRSGAARPCTSYSLADGSLAAHLHEDRPTLIDLRALRPQTRAWKEFDEKSRDLIVRFDAYLVLPDVRPATIVGADDAPSPAGSD